MLERFITYLIYLSIYFYNFFFNGLQSTDNLFLNISNLRLVDLDGHLVSIDPVNDKYFLFLYFDSLRIRDKGILSYAEVLYRKYKHNGLKILGICSGGEAGCKEFHSKGGFSFPFIVNRENVLNQFLNPSYCCGVTLLIEKNGVIKFRSAVLINQENLRQLLEKEIEGKIDYNLALPVLSIPDIKERLFPLSILDLKSQEIKNLKSLVTSDFVILNFYFVFCPACKEARRIITLKKIYDFISSYKINAEIWLLFPSIYNEKDIIEMSKYIDFPFKKLIYFGDFFSDEEKYITDPAKKPHPLILVLDSNLNVIFVESPGQDESLIQRNIFKSIKNK